MEVLILLFLGVSLVFYVVFAGADFGAGIIEFFSPTKKNELQRTVNRALAPVWEANHVWVILAVVILFTAFPPAFSLITTVLHIPLTLMLVGIIFRGCAFTFRHYDACKDKSHIYYTRFFVASSLLTPFSLGLIIAGMTSGRIPVAAAPDFHAVYIAPWFTLYGATLGLFICSLFAYLANVFLIGEDTDSKFRIYMVRKLAFTISVAIAAGVSVFAALFFSEHAIFVSFFRSPVSVGLLLATTGLFAVLYWGIKQGRDQLVRFVASFQVAMIQIGWFWHQYPYLVLTKDGGLHLHDALAGPETLRAMLLALVVGSFLIFPFLFYLFRQFKIRPGSQ